MKRGVLLDRRWLIEPVEMRAGIKLPNKLSKLLLDTPESCYWRGFLLADGSLNFRQMRLKLELAESDECHVRRFCEYLHIPFYDLASNGDGTNFHTLSQRSVVDGKQYRSCRVHVAEKRVMQAVASKYDWKQNKTENPPADICLEGDDFLCCFVGYIDGDGWIGKPHRKQSIRGTRPVVAVKCHYSWHNLLQSMGRKLCRTLGFGDDWFVCWKNKAAHLVLSRFEVVLELKRRVQHLGIPMLERKWSKVDVEYKSDFRRNAYGKWTDEELLRLKASSSLSNDELVAAFPHRSRVSVLQKKCRMNRVRQS